ncbi:hypothetical protein F5Y15DRAFT_248520 [Xylariaceae sp. FL0016]|nr:hypothetical protein F5Y15DRAFT_248520 [Xylariaceae sp. FL0016]
MNGQGSGHPGWGYSHGESNMSNFTTDFPEQSGPFDSTSHSFPPYQQYQQFPHETQQPYDRLYHSTDSVPQAGHEFQAQNPQQIDPVYDYRSFDTIHTHPGQTHPQITQGYPAVWNEQQHQQHQQHQQQHSVESPDIYQRMYGGHHFPQPLQPVSTHTPPPVQRQPAFHPSQVPAQQQQQHHQAVGHVNAHNGQGQISQSPAPYGVKHQFTGQHQPQMQTSAHFVVHDHQPPSRNATPTQTQTIQSSIPHTFTPNNTLQPTQSPIPYPQHAVPQQGAYASHPSSSAPVSQTSLTVSLTQYDPSTSGNASAQHVGPGMIPVPTWPGLLSSQTPVEYEAPSSNLWFASHPSTKGRPICPGKVLPCELLRDYKLEKARATHNTLPEIERQKAQHEMNSLGMQWARTTGGRVPIDTAADNSFGDEDENDDDEDLSQDGQHQEELSQEELEKIAFASRARKIIAVEPRPRDPEGVQQDVVKIVWRDPDNHATYSYNKVVGAFGDYIYAKYWTVINEIRDKIKVTKDKGAKDQLESEMNSKYELMRLAIQAALTFGDNHLLAHMGEHLKLMAALFSALQRRFSTKKFQNDVFAKTILKFLSRITTLTKIHLNERMKFGKFWEKYFSELEDSEIKKYLIQISSNADKAAAEANKKAPQRGTKAGDVTDATKKDQSGVLKKTPTTTAKTTATASTKAPIAKTAGALKKPASETKKIHPVDYSGLGSARKVSNGVSKTSITGSPSKRTRDDDTDSRMVKKVAVEGSTGAPASVKMASTSSASQARPRVSGSSLLSKARVTAKPTVKKPEPQQSSSMSTISGLLAEIAKPVEKPKPREEPVRAPETPEEKARRLRKEARRTLRVAWKPDNELVEYRIFEHDSAEDEGRASNMVRDARDNRSEGQMLKMKRDEREESESDEEEGVERDGKPKVVELRAWTAPAGIDVAALDPSQRQKNYVTRCGLREVESEQQKVMQEYENSQLMAIYTSLSEIPLTPRSPSQKAMEGFSQPKTTQLLPDNPKSQEIHRRWAERQHYGPNPAAHLALQRLGISLSSATQPSTSQQITSNNLQATHRPRMMTQQERDEEILSLLQSDRAKNYVDPDPYDPAKPKTQQRHDYSDPEAQKAIDAIEPVVAQLKGLPVPPTEPPRWLQSNPERVKEWHTGRNNDLAARAKKEANEHATKASLDNVRKMAEGVPASTPDQQAALYAHYVQQQQYAYQQAQQPQVPDQYAAILQQVQALQGGQASQSTPTPSPGATMPPDNNLQSLLTALGQSTQAAPAAASAPDYQYWQAWVQSQAQTYNTQSQQAQAYGGQYGGIGYDPQTYAAQLQAYQALQGQIQGQGSDQGEQHQRDGGDRSAGNRKEFQRNDRGANKDFKDPHKGINRALIGTKPCSFWAKGQCAKGDKCTFRHDPNDLK